uniref:Uncharacterized protein n=1 Tax=Oryzias latipes TaxID=8090 RepID=A0A3P9IEE2_ORYLA
MRNKIKKQNTTEKVIYWDYSIFWTDKTNITVFGTNDKSAGVGGGAEKMLPSLYALGRLVLFLQGNDPKHTSKAAATFLKSRMKVTKSSSMSPDLNPIEHL